MAGRLILALLALGSSSCAAPEPSRATYVGTIEGTGARIAVVRMDEQLEAYVCGEGETLESHTRWFAGELFGVNDAGVSTLASEGWTLSVSESAEHLWGGLRSPNADHAHDWRAERVRDGFLGALGLYESNELGCRAGVIVWDEDPCRAQGAWCDEAGEIGQITPADCPSSDTWRVDALRDGSSFELTVERVEGPR